jgi:hypothetical protein
MKDACTLLAEGVARATGRDLAEIDVTVPVFRYALNSRTLALIVQDRERALGRAPDLDRIAPTESIAELAAAFGEAPPRA